MHPLYLLNSFVYCFFQVLSIYADMNMQHIARVLLLFYRNQWGCLTYKQKKFTSNKDFFLMVGKWFI